MAINCMHQEHPGALSLATQIAETYPPALYKAIEIGVVGEFLWNAYINFAAEDIDQLTTALCERPSPPDLLTAAQGKTEEPLTAPPAYLVPDNPVLDVDAMDLEEKVGFFLGGSPNAETIRPWVTELVEKHPDLAIKAYELGFTGEYFEAAWTVCSGDVDTLAGALDNNRGALSLKVEEHVAAPNLSLTDFASVVAAAPSRVRRRMAKRLVADNAAFSLTSLIGKMEADEVSAEAVIMREFCEVLNT